MVEENVKYEKLIKFENKIYAKFELVMRNEQRII